jgi:hypothetical protein
VRSPNLVAKKATNILLRLFVGYQNYLLACAARTEPGRLCQHCSAGYVETAVQEVRTCAEKNSEIRLSIDSDLSQKFG